MDDWDLEAPKAKRVDPSGGQAPHGPAGAVDAVVAATPQSGGGATRLPARSLRSKIVRIWPLVVGALVLLLIGALAGFFIARSQGEATSAELSDIRARLGVVEKGLAESEERNWGYYRENQALEAQIEELEKGPNGGPAPSTSTTVPGGPATFTDGIYLVGEDISPGDYDGVPTEQTGYWARLRGTDRVVGTILANGLETGPFVLTINPSDAAVELRGVKLTSR